MKGSTKLAVILVCILVTGCVTAPRWHDSGISKALNTDDLLLAAGQPQGIVLGGRPGQTHMPGEYWTERERYFRFSISSGTTEQLMRAYQDALVQKIASLGGKVANGTSAENRGFSFQYNWGGKERIGGWDGGDDGVVGVFYSVGTNAQMQAVLFCYEHKR